LISWTNFTTAACIDLPAPGVDYSNCVLPDDLDGTNDEILAGLDLSNANLSGAQIPNRLQSIDFRGAKFEGAAFYTIGGSINNENLSFENINSHFYDTQFLFSIREEPPGNSEYRVGMFLKGVGFISPSDGNAYGPSGNSGHLAIDRLTDEDTGMLIAGDIAPIRYAVSVYQPWTSLGANSEDGFGFSARRYSLAVSASSNGGSSGAAHYVVDGISEDDGWISNAEESPWWQIDLGGHFRVENIVLTSRNSAGGLEALRDAVVIVSDYPLADDTLTPQNLDSVSRYTALDEPQIKNQIPINRTLRYLRIQKPNAPAQLLGFKSIAVNGFLADASNQAFTPDFPPPQTADIDPYIDVPNECQGELFDENAVRSCEFPLPSLLQTGEILLTDSELDYRNCDLTSEILTNISFNVTLEDGNLSGAFQLQGTDLSGVDLRGADFAGIQLDGASLRGANLTGANFGDADITGVDFRGAVLSDVDLGNVTGNSCALFSNELPESINPQINDVVGLPRPQAIPETTNVGYGYARQSSTDNNGVPTLAIDNDLASYSQTALEDSPWWELDLGAVYNVASIEFLIEPAQHDNIQLLVSDWPFPMEPLSKVDGKEIASHSVTLAPGTTNTFTSPIMRTARYLRIVQSHNGSPQRLSLNNVKVNASGFPTSPSSFVPLTRAQRDLLGPAAEFQDLLSQAENQLSANDPDSLAGELDALNRDAYALQQLLLRYKERFETAYSLRKSIGYARHTLRALKLYRPLRNSAQVKKLEDSLKRAKDVATIIVAQYAALEGLALGGRLALSEVNQGAGAATRQIYSTLRYLNIGTNYLELNLRCVLFDDSGDAFLPLLTTKVADDIPHMQSYLAGLADDTDPRTRIAAHHAAIRATRLALEPIELEIEAIDQAVKALKAAFEAVFSPIAEIGEALSVEIDLGAFSLTAIEIIEAVEKAIDSIPGLAAAEAAVASLIDPLIQPLLEAIDALPELGLPDVPNVGRLAELVSSFAPKIEVSDPFVYDLPPFQAGFDDLAEVACAEVTAPRLWPKNDEDLDGDGLPNGIELKRITPDPYGDKLETLADSADTDLDGLNDYFEVTLAQFVPTTTNFENEVNADFDDDGLTNLEEYLNKTNPFLADTDNDGLTDKVELAAALDPTAADSDHNGINDGDEDSDGDGLINSVEISLALNIAEAQDINHDEDEDGVSNFVEFQKGTDINNAPPLAADDSANVNVGDSVEVDLLGNDSETEGDSIEILEAQIEFPSKGVWSIDNGIVRFETGNEFDMLAPGQSETLAFIYRIQDPGGASSAVVTIIVSAPEGHVDPDPVIPEEPEVNSGGGGAIGWLLVLGLLVRCRCYQGIRRHFYSPNER